MIFVGVQRSVLEQFFDSLDEVFDDEKQKLGLVQAAFDHASEFSGVSDTDKHSQLMGAALFLYLCAHVGAQPYLRGLKQNVVDAVADWVSQEIVKEVHAQVVLMKVGVFKDGRFHLPV